MKTFFYILFLFPVFTSHSQKVVDVGKSDVSTTQLFYVVAGQPVSIAKYVRVIDGSPYFTDSWMKGRLVLPDGHTYDSLLLRLDLIDNSLQYIGADGREMIATTAIKKVTLVDSITGKEYDFVHSSFLESPKTIDPGWYQLLALGPATIYKRVLKTVQENKPYGSATTEQTIRTSSQYFLLANSAFSHVKKLTDLINLLETSKKELGAYITLHNLSGKSDADFVSVVCYYNSLMQR